MLKAAALLVCSIPACLSGQSPTLLKDLNSEFLGNSIPRMFTKVNGKTVFSARTASTSASGLWVTDGTPTGTSRVSTTSPGYLTSLGARAVFRTNQGLWSTDGITASKIHVVDPWVFPDNKLARTSVVFRGRDVAFPHDVELWKTDGTASGTARIANLNPNGPSTPSRFEQVDWLYSGQTFSYTFFEATTPGSGNRLWLTNGTTTGTMQVSPVNHGQISAIRHTISRTGGLSVWFLASESPGYSLYRAQLQTPTSKWTVSKMSIPATPYVWLEAVGEDLYFTASSSSRGPRTVPHTARA